MCVCICVCARHVSSYSNRSLSLILGGSLALARLNQDVQTVAVQTNERLGLVYGAEKHHAKAKERLDVSMRHHDVGTDVQND